MSPPKFASSFLQGLPWVSLWVFFSSRLFSSSTSFKFKSPILKPVFPASTSFRVLPYFLRHPHSISSNRVLSRVVRLSWWGWWWMDLYTGVCSDVTFPTTTFSAYYIYFTLFKYITNVVYNTFFFKSFWYAIKNYFSRHIFTSN